MSLPVIILLYGMLWNGLRKDSTIFLLYLQLTKWTNKTHQYCFCHELHLHEEKSLQFLILLSHEEPFLKTLNTIGLWFLYSYIPDMSPMCLQRINWFWRLRWKFGRSSKGEQMYEWLVFKMIFNLGRKLATLGICGLQ